jgi:hypothetical protein
MKFEVFIHNDDMKCFHMVVQWTQKVVVMGYINFKDETLIKRWRACKKMNKIGGKLKNKNKQGNCRKLFSFVVGSCEHIWNSRVHTSITLESAIEKLQRIAKEKEV